MHLGVAPARQARARHRLELRSLTYLTLDQGNGGIIRNLTHDGVAAQVVAAVRPRQKVHLHFELRYPRLRIETRGEVIWATFSGQCGIRFLDLTPRMQWRIDEWIFGNLLEGTALYEEEIPAKDRPWFMDFRPEKSRTAASGPASEASEPETGRETEEDGLMVSAAPSKVIALPTQPERQGAAEARAAALIPLSEPVELDWLSQPLSSRGLAWTVNTLAIAASLLLCALVFLAVTRELPRWPLVMAAGAAIFVTGLYWGFFKLFGGASPGTRLARLAGYDVESEREAQARFR